jgi:hypothetical protein
MRMRSFFSLAALTMLATGALASPAFAAQSSGELVSGTTLGTLALTGTSATFTTNFTPGGTATATGLLTATNTAASSTLTVGDSGAAPAGHMRATGGTCTGSDADLTNALTTNVTGTGITSSGVTAIPAAASAATVATAAVPIAAKALTTNYSQSIPAAQVMLTGCVYTLTATYTLQ